MAIKIRRGTNADRLTVVLEEGEVAYTTDTKKFYIGDGTTLGGNEIGVDKVPYTGATQDVNLGEFGVQLGNLEFDITPTNIPTAQGSVYWDDNAETLALIMNGTTQKVGEDIFYHVRNTTGSTIPKGTAVRFAGTTGNSGRLLIAPMIANGTSPSQYYMGVTSEEILDNADGKVYQFGKMRGVNTSAFTDGDILYVSTTVAGAFQTTAPTAPNNIIVAAAVVHSANNGTLMIRQTLGSNINADEGVLITTPANNNVLTYESSTSLWKNKTVETALGFTPVPTTRTLTINGTTQDLSANRTFTIATGLTVGTTPITSGTVGRVLFEGTGNVLQESSNLFWDNTNSRLGIGTASPATSLDVRGNVAIPFGNRIQFNGENFYEYSGLSFAGAVTINANNNNYIRFNGNNVERMRIFGSTGNVGIGTTTDAGYKLDVNGTARISGALSAAGGNATGTGSVSIGTLSSAGGNFYAAAIGYQSTASNSHAIAIGYGATASANSSYAFGRAAIASASNSTAFSNSLARADNSVAWGNNSRANGISSMAGGAGSFSYLTGQLAISGGSITYYGDSQYSMFTSKLSTNAVSSGGTYSFTGVRPSNETFSSGVSQMWYLECVIVFSIKGKNASVTEFALDDIYTIKYKLAVKSNNNTGTQILGTPVADSSFSNTSLASTAITFTIVSNNLVVNVTPPTWSSAGQVIFRGTASFRVTELGTYPQTF